MQIFGQVTLPWSRPPKNIADILEFDGSELYRSKIQYPFFLNFEYSTSKFDFLIHFQVKKIVFLQP